VRHGGFKAIEYNFSEFYPVTVGFRIGVEKFYTSIIAAYNPFGTFNPNNIAGALGIGSIIPIGNIFCINPELIIYSPSVTEETNQQLLSFVPALGINLNKNFSIVTGPSVTWVNSEKGTELQKPYFKIMENTINENNNIVIGARVGLRFRF
jgi:hypothetical protein